MVAPTNRLIGCGIGCVTVPLLAVALIFGLFQWWLASSRADSERLLQAARDAGQPVTDVELAKEYARIPEGEVDVTKAFLELAKPLDREAYKLEIQPLKIVNGGFDFPRRGELFREQEDCVAFLERKRETLDRLYELTQPGSTCRFEVTKSQTGSEHINLLDSARRLALLDGVIAARYGDAAGATRSIMAQFWLSEVMRHDPTGIAQTLGGIHFEVACHLIADSLSHVPFSDEQLAKFEAAIKRFDSSQVLRLTLYGERAVGLQIIADPTMLIQDEDSQGEVKATLDADKSFFLGVLDRMLKASDLAPYERLQKANSIQAEAIAAMQTVRGRIGYTLSRSLLPSLQALTATPIHSESMGRATMLAIEIERFRRAQKRLPESLAELKLDSKLTTDPVSNKPYDLRRTEQGFEIETARAKIEGLAPDPGEHEGHDHGPGLSQGPGSSQGPAPVLPTVLKLRYED